MEILLETGAKEFHSTAKSQVRILSDPINKLEPTYNYETSADIVSEMKRLMV